MSRRNMAIARLIFIATLLLAATAQAQTRAWLDRDRT